jgi:DNA-binding GntR family transcriptional regulator
VAQVERDGRPVPDAESPTASHTPAHPASHGASRTIGARHLTLRDQVLAELRRRIVEAEYGPGERLREDRLAQDFGVSRNPVREALRVVEAEGFVHVEPRRGAVVATPDERTIGDMFAVRALLEPLAARLAAERASATDLVGLRGLLEQARTATEAGDYERVAELNTALHARVAELSGNRWVVQFSATMYRHVQWVFRLGAPVRAVHSWREHVRLVEALEAGDGDAAQRAAAQHVDAARRAAVEDAAHAARPG